MIEPRVARFLLAARVAHLGTASADARPHVVPIVFALSGERLYSALDEKPKQVASRRLRRARNLQENPRGVVVVDCYDEDWSRLGYVMLEGNVRLLESGPEHVRAIQLLRQRYAQYASQRLEEHPVIALDIERVAVWGAIPTE